MKCCVADLLTTKRIGNRWCMTLWTCPSQCKNTLALSRGACLLRCWIATRRGAWGPPITVPKISWVILSSAISTGLRSAIVKCPLPTSRSYHRLMTPATSIRCSQTSRLLRPLSRRLLKLLHRRLNSRTSRTTQRVWLLRKQTPIIRLPILPTLLLVPKLLSQVKINEIGESDENSKHSIKNLPIEIIHYQAGVHVVFYTTAAPN